MGSGTDVQVWTDRAMYDPESMTLIRKSEDDPTLVLIEMSAARYGRFVSAVQAAKAMEQS